MDMCRWREPPDPPKDRTRPGGCAGNCPTRTATSGTNGMQSGVHGERARLACRAVRPARHTGRPQAFGTPWVATCIPRGREGADCMRGLF